MWNRFVDFLNEHNAIERGLQAIIACALIYTGCLLFFILVTL
jgi:hypothetical protein